MLLFLSYSKRFLEMTVPRATAPPRSGQAGADMGHKKRDQDTGQALEPHPTPSVPLEPIPELRVQVLGAHTGPGGQAPSLTCWPAGLRASRRDK